MIDGLTLDQLRIFITAADAGSFSAAGRKLRRAQSVVSQTVMNLECQLGVELFDRTERLPRLTEAGRALLLEARAVANQVDALRARAKAMSEGLEPELSVAVDVMYPMDNLTRAATDCRESFPGTTLRLYVEALGGVTKLVLDGACRIGIVGSLPIIPDELESVPLLDVPLVTVAAPNHPLAAQRGRIVRRVLEKHVQLVLTDRTSLSDNKTFGVLSPLTWRLADLGAKHAFLVAGLGWGHMPLHMVQKDIEAGSLVKLEVDGFSSRALLPMYVVYRKDAVPGPAARAFVSKLGVMTRTP